MISNTDLFLNWACPGLGTIMASAMFAAPIHSLKEAISRGSLGDLNPTPWAFMTGNCLGWVAYSVIKQDMWVLISNAPGLILSIWLNMGAAKLQYQEIYRSNNIGNIGDVDGDGDSDSNSQGVSGGASSSRSTSYSPINASHAYGHAHSSIPSLTPHEHWVLRVTTIWMIVLAIACFTPIDDTIHLDQAQFIGLVVNVNLIIFYGAPLSTIAAVLRARDSVSIHRRTLAMGLLNSSFWLGYGIGLMDMVIFIPNMCGFLLSVVQIILCVIFPKRVGGAGVDSGTNDNVDVHRVEML